MSISIDIDANNDIIAEMRRKQTDLGKQLREAFRSSGMSMFALSKQSGVPYSGIHRFINADRDLTLSTASKVADVLGLELRQVDGR